MMKSVGLVLCVMVLLCLQARAEDRKEVEEKEPATEPSTELVKQLLSGDAEKSAAAHVKLVRQGERVLPLLIETMNDPKYASTEVDLKKLGDPKWIARMTIARAIQAAAKVEFDVNTTASGWNPDHSFELINKWWKARQEAGK